eukprot:m.130961 g.130961  ORF g.130961 m.130961 type:complete len:471 (-) comp29514_c0_seq3:124-1536(-)
MTSVALIIITVAQGAPPTGWKTCGNLTDAYNNTACPSSQSCAQQAWVPSNGSWGCCPFPEGVSCSPYTCCPKGTKCKNQPTWGIRGGFGVLSVCLDEGNDGSNNSIEHPQFPHVIGSGNATIGDQVCKTGPPIAFSTTLKNVLIIGDSVSIGYTPWVATAMENVALVQHSPWGQDGGAEEAQFGARCITNLIRAPDGTPLSPDVLMFNWGLHNSLSGNCTPPMPTVSSHTTTPMWSSSSSSTTQSTLSSASLTSSMPTSNDSDCKFIVNCDMGKGERAKVSATTKEECCSLCRASPTCGAGILDDSNNCWFKSAQDVYAGCSPGPNTTGHNITACLNPLVPPQPPSCDPGQSGAPSEYAPYLQQIVDSLKAAPALANTKLLFAITSPDICNSPIDAIQVELNTQAKIIMDKAGIPTVDLYAVITGKCGKVPQASCFGAVGCFCPHCYGNGQLGYQWLTNSTIVPAISQLL